MAGRSVAVIGMLRSGKTTLITSLIDHWLNHDSVRLPLRNGHEILCQWKDSHSEGARAFEKARQNLTDGRWPGKTLKPMSYHLSLRLKHEYFWRSISIHDVPGERLADVDMIDCGDLDRWSDHMVHLFETDPLTRGPFSKFSKLFKETRELAEHQTWLDELEQAYREFLATLIVQQHPLVTPSSMLIDKDGNYVPIEVRKDVEMLTNWLKESAALGCGDKKLFPLPKSLMATASGKVMQKGFHEYLQNVVWPSLAPLAASEDVIVLTDIAAILEHGPTWKNTILHLYKLIAKIVDPGGFTQRAFYQPWAWLSYLSTLGFYSPKATQRIIVIASQADRVHQDDQDKLRELIIDLSKPAFRHIQFNSAVTIETLSAAAVLSTSSKPGRVIQYVRKKDQTVEEVEATVPELPIQFEDDWQAGDYRFPVCRPRMPALRARPPHQFGLQELTQKLL